MYLRRSFHKRASTLFALSVLSWPVIAQDSESVLRNLILNTSDEATVAAHAEDLVILDRVIGVNGLPTPPVDVDLVEAYPPEVLEPCGQTLQSSQHQAGFSAVHMADLYLRTLREVLTGFSGKTPDSDGGEFDGEKRIAGESGCSYCFTLAGVAKLEHVGKLVLSAWSLGKQGDFLEAGTWKGGVSIYIAAVTAAHHNSFAGALERKIVLADTFTGIPFRSSYVSAAFWKGHASAGGCAEVKRNFMQFGLLSDRISFVEGPFVSSLPLLRARYISEGRQLAVLFIDADMHESYTDVLYNLYDLVMPQGYIVCDDCRCINEADRAVIAFLQHHALPTAVKVIPGARCGVFWQKRDDVSIDLAVYQSWIALRQLHVQRSQGHEDSSLQETIEEVLTTVFLEQRVVSSGQEISEICQKSNSHVILWVLPPMDLVPHLDHLERHAIWSVAEAFDPRHDTHCANVVVMDWHSFAETKFGDASGRVDYHEFTMSWGPYMHLLPLCGPNTQFAIDLLGLLHKASTGSVGFHPQSLRSWLYTVSPCHPWANH